LPVAAVPGSPARKEAIVSKRWLVVVLALATFCLVAVPAAAGPKGIDRPFSASYEGFARWEFPGSFPPGCKEVTTISGATGIATHLGRVDFAGWHCPAEPANRHDGHATITAANGDELHVRYDYDPLDETNVIPFTFDGGTGRFEGASGSGEWTYGVAPVMIEGCTDPDPFACMDFTVPWEWWSTMEGSISY
jgi:hypothetical protein